MGFRVGRLVGVEVGLRHSGQQLGSRVGVYGSGAVGWLPRAPASYFVHLGFSSSSVWYHGQAAIGGCGGWITAFGKAVGFKSRCLRQWGSRLATEGPG